MSRSYRFFRPRSRAWDEAPCKSKNWPSSSPMNMGTKSPDLWGKYQFPCVNWRHLRSTCEVQARHVHAWMASGFENCQLLASSFWFTWRARTWAASDWDTSSGASGSRDYGCGWHLNWGTPTAANTSSHPDQPIGVSLAWYPRSRLWVQRPSPGSPSKCWLRLIVHCPGLPSPVEPSGISSFVWTPSDSLQHDGPEHSSSYWDSWWWGWQYVILQALRSVQMMFFPTCQVRVSRFEPRCNSSSSFSPSSSLSSSPPLLACRRTSYHELQWLWAVPGPEQRECQKRMSERMSDRMSE